MSFDAEGAWVGEWGETCVGADDDVSYGDDVFFFLVRTPLEILFVFQRLERTMKDYFLAAKV